jgi:hypothetical protein
VKLATGAFSQELIMNEIIMKYADKITDFFIVLILGMIDDT